MKGAPAKKAPATPVSKTTPFFGKESGGEFFHSNKAESSFFPSKITAAPGVQTKLTIGKPNDPYEKEADSMADKVVQRLAEPRIQKKSLAPDHGSSTLLQPKCNTCDQEEKIQKKDPDKNTLQKKIFRKAIFESNEEQPVQRKPLGSPMLLKKSNARIPESSSMIQPKCNECEQEEKLQKKETVDKPQEKLQMKPAAEGKEVHKNLSMLQTLPAILPKAIAPVSAKPAIQAKCSSCEQEEKQELDEEGDSDVQTKIQKKPIFETNSRNGNEVIQRSCRECEEGHAIFLKPVSLIQRAGEGEVSGDGSRESIVVMAKGELGKVQAKQNDGSGKRVGSDRLLEYFHIAAPDVWDDSIIETHGAKMPSWCGIFSVWAHKKAGKDIGNWQMGRGVSAFGTLTQTDSPQPGDIGYIDQPYQHHCIIERIDGDTIHSIDGNSGLFSEVIQNQRARSEYSGFMTAFGGGSSGQVQTKGEDNSGIIQTKSGDTVPSPSVEHKLNASKGNGQSLPESTRAGMEQGFGADFGNVKIHTDSNAVQMSKDLHAQAFTHGSDIYFNSGKFDTGSSGGQHLLAHELTHVIQQGSASTPNINRSATTPGTVPDPEGSGAELTPEELEAKVKEDLSKDDFGGGSEELPQNENENPDSEGPSPGGGENDADSEVPEEEESGSEEEGAPEEEEKTDEKTEDPEGADSVPDDTPVKPSTDECPKIVPDFPDAPNDSTLPPTEDKEFFEEVWEIMTNNTLMPGIALLRPFGVGAYFAWRKLPMFAKIRVINFILDQAIGGAYWGRYNKTFTDSRLFSAMMLGFLKRIRRMPDDQKVYMFEKFGKLILKGDTTFTLGLLKGILIGFFLDGLLGIIQMVIDLICIVPKILDFFRSVKDFLSELPYEVELLMNSIAEMMSSLGDVVSNAMSEMMDMIKHPERILAIFENIEQATLNAAEKVGEAMAEGIIRYAALPAARLGEVIGRIGGQLIFEALLIVITKGGGATVTAAKSALRFFGKAIGTIGKQIFKLVRMMGKVLKFIRNVITKIIKFLTPLLKTVAKLARRVIDRLAALFKSFRRHCKPGSVKCKLPKPKCKGKFVPRLGGFLPHDRYIRRVTRTNRDYRLRGTVFGLPVPCNYDALMGRLLVEGKTGYHYLPFIEKTKPSLYKMIMFRFNEQRWRCMAIAARCLHPYVWYMQSGPAAAFLNARWHGTPPVLHVP